MKNLRWIEESGQSESLAAALRAVLARYGDDRPYELLLATLGLGMLVTAHHDEPLRHWPTLGRDVHLIETAALFGLRFRPLHPPDAADGLGRSTEFALHFHDSYLPLIRTALAHEQAVLAWRGWPAPSSRCWGVITEEREDGLFGYTVSQNRECVPLIDPAHQVYIVEGFQKPACPPTTDDLLCRALRIMHELWNGRHMESPGLMTGESAYRAWLNLLTQPAKSDSGEITLIEQHVSAVRALLAARRSMVAFLRGADTHNHDHVRQWANSCERVIELLAPFENPTSDDAASSPAVSLASARLALDAAREADSQVANKLSDILP